MYVEQFVPGPGNMGEGGIKVTVISWGMLLKFYNTIMFGGGGSQQQLIIRRGREKTIGSERKGPWQSLRELYKSSFMCKQRISENRKGSKTKAKSSRLCCTS
jgi:hypothetical protein